MISHFLSISLHTHNCGNHNLGIVPNASLSSTYSFLVSVVKEGWAKLFLPHKKFSAMCVSPVFSFDIIYVVSGNRKKKIKEDCYVLDE